MSWVSRFSTYAEFADYILSHPEEAGMLYNIVKSQPGQMEQIFKTYRSLYEQQQAQANGQNADYNDVLGQIAGNSVEMSPEMEKYLDNLISNQRTEEAREYETKMRDTSLISTGQQLSQLGLSSSGVLSVGGAVSNGVGAAGTSKHSAASMHQQERINQFNQKMSLAKSLIGAAGSMASSGIYGSAIGAIKQSAAALSASAAHSGLAALKSLNKPSKISQQDIDKFFATGQIDGVQGYQL